MSLQRSWRKDPPPISHDAHAPFLVNLTNAIADLSHSNGRIEATLGHMDRRLEDGDRKFGEIQATQDEIKAEIAEVRAEVATVRQAPRPSRITALKGLIETSAPLVREAWPFLAVSIAATAKALGYDLSGVLGQ